MKPVLPNKHLQALDPDSICTTTLETKDKFNFTDF